jgi:hypothetical protein
MSLKHLSWAMNQQGLAPEQKLILIAIGDVFDANAEAQTIGIDYIADFCGIRDDHLMRQLALMNNDGVLKLLFFGAGVVNIFIGREAVS